MNQPSLVKTTALAPEMSNTMPLPPPVSASAPQRPGARAVPAAEGRSAFLPLLLCSLALLVWFTAQLVDAFDQRQQLLAGHGQQQQTVDKASQLRQSLDALASDTQRLADAGNANAAVLVTELRNRGITIKVPAAGEPAAAKPAASGK